MPFTSQQLMELFELDQVSAPSLNTYYVSHPNFKIMVDYLGGNSSSLNGLTADYENITFQKLLSLLKEIDPVTPNEQLILDVFTHPHIYPYTKHFLAQWLIFYGVNGNSAKAFAAVAAVFKNLGISNDEIFLLYIQHLHYAFNGSRPPDATGDELKKYLLTILPNQLVLKIPYTGGLYWGNSGWSSLYFQLIEEGKPAFIKDYLLSGLMELEQFAINYILHYRQGKYVVIVTNWLQEPSKSNQEFEKKFQIVIHLYQLDNEKFYKLALTFSRSYISYHQLNKPDEKWQRHLHLRTEELKDNTYISFSAAAIYFLLLDDPASTQETVLEWYKSKVPITFDVLRILYVKLKESALPYLQRGLKTDASSGGTEAYRKIINLLVKEFQSKDYIEILWELASSKSKPLREEVAKLLAEKDENAEQKAIQLLQSKNAESRQTAALVLSFFNSANSINAVKAILNTEANDNARDLLLQIAAASLPVKADKEFINEIVQAAANRNKLNKPIETWLNEIELPPFL